MVARELANILMENPECEVWMGAYNGHADTYAVVDRVCKFKYSSIFNDFYGTPGRMDKRLFDSKRYSLDDSEVLYIDSKFGIFPNNEVDIGSDDVDIPIKLYNGKDGDPNLWLKLNSLTQNEGNIWVRNDSEKGYNILYNTQTEILKVNNTELNLRFEGKITTVDTFNDVLKCCRIPL